MWRKDLLVLQLGSKAGGRLEDEEEPGQGKEEGMDGGEVWGPTPRTQDPAIRPWEEHGIHSQTDPHVDNFL